MSSNQGSIDVINVRKVYSSPKLVVYGDFRSITQTVGTTGGNDQGPTGMNKKSLP